MIMVAGLRNRFRWVFLGSLAFVFSVIVGGSALKIQHAAPLPVYGQVPAFSLTDQSGKAFGLKELAGQVWVADFIFTSCPGTCPRMTSRLSRLQAQWPP